MTGCFGDKHLDYVENHVCDGEKYRCRSIRAGLSLKKKCYEKDHHNFGQSPCADGSQVRVYLDGVLDGSLSNSSRPAQEPAV